MDSNIRMRTGHGRTVMTATMDAIEDFNRVLDAELAEATRSAGKAVRLYLRANSPKQPNGGAYARSWSCDYDDRDGHHEAIVYSREPHYRLTHLLVDGHKSYNQYGGPHGPAVKPAEPVGYTDKADECGRRIIKKMLGVSL